MTSHIQTAITAILLFLVILSYAQLFLGAIRSRGSVGSVAEVSMTKLIASALFTMFLVLGIYNIVFLYYNYGKNVTFSSDTVLLGQLILLIIPCIYCLAAVILAKLV